MRRGERWSALKREAEGAGAARGARLRATQTLDTTWLCTGRGVRQIATAQFLQRCCCAAFAVRESTSKLLNPRSFALAHPVEAFAGAGSPWQVGRIWAEAPASRWCW